jgi:hypothetical protein
MLMMRRSGLERLRMSAEMSASARVMLSARLEAEGLVPGTVEFRERVFLTVYGDDFTPAAREKWLERLRRRWSASG